MRNCPRAQFPHPDLLLVPTMTQSPSTWSTDGVQTRERFDYWREMRAKRLFGVTIEMPKHQQAHFHGSLSTQPVGAATIVEMHASPYDVRRTEADIARHSSDSLCIYQQLDGACWFGTGAEEEFVIRAGELALSHSDLPYRTAPTTEKGFHLRLVKIPFGQCRTFIASHSDLAAQRLTPEPGIGALFASYFESFIAQAPHLKGPAADSAVQMLAQLALIARGSSAPKQEPTQEALRAARLERARLFIESNLHRPDLTPARTATLLGVSVRQLHLLFAPTGTTFGRFVMGRRLERARLLLSLDARRPVLEIALACGIESSSVFYRGFRDTYGMSPNEFRESSAKAGELLTGP
jgi:AraC-like DNA-binding protein